MTLRPATLALTLVVSFLVVRGPARAGGWWSSIDVGRYLGIGETVTARAEVWFPSLELAEDARQDVYHAYLARGIDRERLEQAMTRAEPKDWWTQPAEMMLVGDVRLRSWDANIAIATAHVTVPHVAPGSYHLMLCDAGCITPLGNVIPLRVDVAADVLLAKTARKLEATNERSELALARVRSDLRRVAAHVEGAQTKAAETRARVARLQARLSLSNEQRPSPWIVYAGWFAAGAASALAVVRRRKVALRAQTQPPVAEVPDDARELIRNP